MTHRTRVKLCGLTTPEDVKAAAQAGADAIGLVFYPPSPRHVSAQQAAILLADLPPFITSVGLFVNAGLAEIQQVLRSVPLSMQQFHGDETPDQCAAVAETVARPFLRAFRIRPETTAQDLLESQRLYSK